MAFLVDRIKEQSQEARNNKTNLPPGFELIPDAKDITVEVFTDTTHPYIGLIDKLFTRSLIEMRQEFCKDSLDHNPTSVKVIPYPEAKSTSRHTVDTPGLQISQPTSSKNKVLGSRNALLADGWVVKGVGTDSAPFEPQFTTVHKAWGVLGGVIKEKGILDIVNGLLLSELYSSIFPHEKPPFRVAAFLTDLENQVTNTHHNEQLIQLHFPPQESHVRNNFFRFISDPSSLFYNLDLEQQSGREEAVRLFNTVLGGVTTEYITSKQGEAFKSETLTALTMQDFENIKAEGMTIFELLGKYRKSLEGEDIRVSTWQKVKNLFTGKHHSPDLYTKNDLNNQQKYMTLLAEVGYHLAEEFYLDNEIVINSSIYWHAQRLAKTVGLSIIFGESFSKDQFDIKDLFGGTFCDFDNISFNISNLENLELTQKNFEDNINNALLSVIHPLRGYGLDQIKISHLANYFIDQIRESLSHIFLNLEALPITEVYREYLMQFIAQLFEDTIIKFEKGDYLFPLFSLVICKSYHSLPNELKSSQISQNYYPSFSVTMRNKPLYLFKSGWKEIIKINGEEYSNSIPPKYEHSFLSEKLTYEVH